MIYFTISPLVTLVVTVMMISSARPVITSWIAVGAPMSDEAEEDNVDDKLTNDNGLQRHTIFLKCQSEEAAHGRYKVTAHGCHTGYSYHGRSVADGQDCHHAQERAAQDECQNFVFIYIDTHVFGNKLVASDGVCISSDFRVVQEDVSCHTGQTQPG